MYFWNTRQLAFDLREGKVTQRQQMWYLFAYVVLTTLSILLLDWFPSESSFWSKISDVAVAAVTVVGFLACYQANSRGDDDDFVIRFICMGWPVMRRVLAIAFALGVLFAFVVSIAVPGYVDPLLDWSGVLIEVSYFALLRSWLIEISGTAMSA